MISTALARVIDGQRLTRAEMSDVVAHMLSGAATPVQTAALLVALRTRGETTEELVGAVTAVRAQAHVVELGALVGPVVDTCGTGGDGAGTFNVSTAAAVVTAACGVTVAKHGNRSVSSKCGSADVLAALGANVEMPVERIADCIRATRLGFLFAPAHHPTFRHVAAVRRELGVRTLFNLVGPLANPAGARRQVIGVFDPKWVPLVADALVELGTEHALVVHGSGLDELTVCGESVVEEVRRHGDGRVERRSFRFEPESLGFTRRTLAEVQGGTPDENAAIVRKVLAGEPGGARDLVVLNSAAALLVAGAVTSLRDGVTRASEAIDLGAAERLLAQFVRFTKNEFTTLDAIVASAPPEPVVALAPSKRVASLGFAASLSSSVAEPLRVIAEVKRASPSAGAIAAIADPVALARRYAAAGAAAISVLTERAHFNGSLDDLRAVSAGQTAPTLRKDFVTTPAHIHNARQAGASAVLLIAAVLGSRLRHFVEVTRAAQLDALVEVHDEAELELALRAGADVIGINHRDLRTFHIDLSLSQRLLPRIPPTVRAVCESGVRSVDDAKRLRDHGATNLLIGEFLVRAEDPGALLHELGAL